jgi:hypothetical protein
VCNDQATEVPNVESLSAHWSNIRLSLFPSIAARLPEPTEKQWALIQVLEVVRIEEHVSPGGFRWAGTTAARSPTTGTGVCGEGCLQPAAQRSAA